MKKYLFLAIFAAFSFEGFAQVVENFEVGPYEVEYKGTGDYKFRIRKDVDIKNFFEIKNDTVYVTKEDLSAPLASAWELNLLLAIPGHGITGCSNKFGIHGGYKLQIGSQLYFNGGLNASFSFGDYGQDWDYMTETMFEAAIPLTIELTDLNRQKASLFGGVGVVPTFFSSLSNKTKSGVDAYDNKDFSKSGFYLAPILNFGAYVPVGDQLFKVGVFAQYNINFKEENKDIYAQRIGRFVVGANLGLIF